MRLLWAWTLRVSVAQELGLGINAFDQQDPGENAETFLAQKLLKDFEPFSSHEDCEVL